MKFSELYNVLYAESSIVICGQMMVGFSKRQISLFTKNSKYHSQEDEFIYDKLKDKIVMHIKFNYNGEAFVQLDINRDEYCELVEMIDNKKYRGDKK